MNPPENNLAELQRLRESVKSGEPVDWKREAELADFDDAIAEAKYTQDAIDRVNDADDELRRRLLGERPA